MIKPEVIVTVESQELSINELRTLEACEEDISRGIELQAKALQVVRDRKLYRHEFDTFDEYVKDRVGKSKRWADYQISYIEVMTTLTEQMGTIVPKITEGATREIADLAPEQQVAVVSKVVEKGEKPTAKNIKAEREDLETPEETQPEESHVSTGSVVLDSLERPVPGKYRDVHESTVSMRVIATSLSNNAKQIESLMNKPGGECIDQMVVIELRRLRSVLLQSGYLTVCPRCDSGNLLKSCDLCSGRGWMPKRLSEHMTDRERREISFGDRT